MRPDRAGPVGEGAAQGEIHPGADVVGRPVGRAVLSGLHQSAHEGAVGIRPPRPDMALVEMGVDVDKSGQHDSAIEIDSVALGIEARRAGGENGCDAPAFNRNVDEAQSLSIRCKAALRDEGQGHTRPEQAVGISRRDLGEAEGHPLSAPATGRSHASAEGGDATGGTSPGR
jgi:hypothetical protein